MYWSVYTCSNKLSVLQIVKTEPFHVNKRYLEIFKTFRCVAVSISLSLEDWQLHRVFSFRQNLSKLLLFLKLHNHLTTIVYLPSVLSLSIYAKGMQNLSISCSLVCLIILGSAALVGAFGVCQRQISAVLVTGVMYLLAGEFIVFLNSVVSSDKVLAQNKNMHIIL